MSGDHFNTLDTARDLAAAGIERPQAEAIALAIARTGGQLATKTDVQRIETATKADLERHEASTKAQLERHEASTTAQLERHEASTTAQLERHEASTRADFERFEAATRADIARIEANAATKTDLADLRADMYRALWIQGAGIVAIVTALEFLP